MIFTCMSLIQIGSTGSTFIKYESLQLKNMLFFLQLGHDTKPSTTMMAPTLLTPPEGQNY